MTRTSSHDRFAEWDEPATIAAVEAALQRAGAVIRLEADADFPRKLRDARPDIVFNIAEGLNGPSREAHVPAMCEFYGIPYTGSDVLTLALALDKRRAKEVFAARGVPTAPFATLRPGEQLPADFPLPAVVKPVHEGSSMGVPRCSRERRSFTVAQHHKFLDVHSCSQMTIDSYSLSALCALCG